MAKAFELLRKGRGRHRHCHAFPLLLLLVPLRISEPQGSCYSFSIVALFELVTVLRQNTNEPNHKLHAISQRLVQDRRPKRSIQTLSREMIEGGKDKMFVTNILYITFHCVSVWLRQVQRLFGEIVLFKYRVMKSENSGTVFKATHTAAQWSPIHPLLKIVLDFISLF